MSKGNGPRITADADHSPQPITRQRVNRYEVLLFAAAREMAGTERIAVELPTPTTAAAVLAAVAARRPELAPLIPACRLAVDQAFVTPDVEVAPAAELALIPPVSGG